MNIQQRVSEWNSQPTVQNDDKPVRHVFSTLNHDQFKSLSGNRKLDALHLSRLEASVKERNLLSASPITVNERYEVIDGQHRLEVAKKLGFAIYYQVVPGLRLEDIQVLNTNTVNWNMDDFMEAYINLGHESYAIYKKFKKYYGFGHPTCRYLLMGRTSTDRSASDVFRKGKLKIDNLKRAEEWAERIQDFAAFYDGYQRRSFVVALMRMFSLPKYNHDRMIKKLGYQSSKLVDATTATAYIDMLEEIYNFKSQSKLRFY